MMFCGSIYVERMDYIKLEIAEQNRSIPSENS